jgi:hypothetical protein
MFAHSDIYFRLHLLLIIIHITCISLSLRWTSAPIHLTSVLGMLGTQETCCIVIAGLLDRDTFDLFLLEFDKPWVIHLRETCCCSTNPCTWRPNTVYKNRRVRRHHHTRLLLDACEGSWRASLLLHPSAGYAGWSWLLLRVKELGAGGCWRRPNGDVACVRVPGVDKEDREEDDDPSILRGIVSHGWLPTAMWLRTKVVGPWPMDAAGVVGEVTRPSNFHYKTDKPEKDVPSCGNPAYHCMCSMQVVDITPMKHYPTSITSIRVVQ